MDFDRTRIKKILIVRNDNIGDVINTTPAIEALRLSFPNAFIAALVANYARDVLVGNPCLDRLYSYEKLKHCPCSRFNAWSSLWRVLRDIRSEAFDMAIGIRSKFTKTNAWLVYMSGAEYRVGHRPRAKTLMSSRYYNIYVDDETEEVHEVERALNCVRRVGADIKDKQLSMRLEPADYKDADGFIIKNSLSRSNIVCLHISARQEEGRWWPVENYVRVIEALKKREDITLVLNWVDKDGPLAREIVDKLSAPPLVFKPHGSRLKGFAAFLKRCALLITLEGGAMHIGATQKTPTIAIFGKTSAKLWAPWGAGNIILKNNGNASSVFPAEVIEASHSLLYKQMGAQV